MDDSIFANLDLLARYKDDIDDFIDPVQIVKKCICLKPGTKTAYKTRFIDKGFSTNL